MFRKTWMVLMSVVVLVGGWTVSAEAQEAMCAEEQLRANIQRVIDEGFNQGMTASVDEAFAEEYISHPDELDREDFKAQIEALRTALPSGEAHIEQVLVEGCDAFLVFHMSGVMEGELTFPGQEALQPTGEDLSIDSHIYLRFNSEGQVVEEWDYFDNLSFLTQVGMLPAAEEAESMEDELGAEMTDEVATTSGNEARNTEMVRQAYEDAFNAGNMDLIRELYSPDYVGHLPDGATASLDDLVTDLTALRSAMPDAMITVNDSVAQGNQVATRVTLTGTFQNELMLGDQTIPPTGETFSLEISFLHLLDENGLVVEDWQLLDQLSFLTQLGLLSAPEATEQTG